MTNDGGPAYIHLLDGDYAVVSPDVHAVLNRRLWRRGANGYIYARGARKKGVACLMHRLIMDAKAGEEVHHLNGNKLDNRRENLTIYSASEHQNHHKHLVIARNRANRKYALTLICPECHQKCLVNPNHRGRNRFCSKLCGNRYNSRLRRTHG